MTSSSRTRGGNQVRSLFARLINLDEATASIVFFKYRDNHQRTSMINEILKRKHGSAYKAFWNQFQDRFLKLCKKRNFIVHLTPIGEFKNGTETPLLVGSDFLANGFARKLKLHDLLAFVSDCTEAKKSCICFAAFLGPDRATALGSQLEAWQEIFQQPSHQAPNLDYKNQKAEPQIRLTPSSQSSSSLPSQSMGDAAATSD